MNNFRLTAKRIFYLIFNLRNLLILWLMCISYCLIILTRIQIRLAETGLDKFDFNEQVPDFLISHLEFIWKKLYYYNFLLFDYNFFFFAASEYDRAFFFGIVIGIIYSLCVFWEHANPLVIHYTIILILVLYITILLCINWDLHNELILIDKFVKIYQKV